MRNFLCFLLLASQVSLAQISGVVSDLESKKPLPAATVFINRTNLSSKCDTKGAFSINNIPPGFWDIVVYNEGHELFKSSVRVTEDKRYKLSLELVRKKSVSKTKFKPNEEWNKNLEWFQQALLGTGSNAVNCTIKNPKDLLFSKEGENLRVVAQGPLFIENNSTGYRIVYHLLNFEAGVEQVKSEGFLFFDSLGTLDPMVRSSWEKERSRTYWGSERHLFRALLDGEVRAQGFELLNASGKKLNKDTLVSPAKLQGYSVIHLKGKTKVTYRMEKGTSGIQQTDQAGQVSWLTPNGVVEVNDVGVLFNPQTLTVSGHMALSKLSDDLPYNYFPASSLEEEKMDWKNFALLKEKIYIHTDRDYYYPRENIWFKVYMRYSMPMLRDTLSKTLYVELISNDKKIIRSKVFRIKEGVCWGDFKLPDSLSNGEYYLRAYTNWMKNYDENNFFIKPIPILLVEQNLVDARQEIDPLGGEVSVIVRSEANEYSTRAEIKLDIEVRSTTGKTLISNMSVSVTDAFSSVPLPESKNILSNGFQVVNTMGDTTRYFNEIKYFMEKGLSFRGVVKDEKENPTPAKIDIIQGNMENLISMDTDEKGEFMVTGMDFKDSSTFAFKPVNKKGRPLPKVDILPKEVPEFMTDSKPLTLNFRQENALQRIQNTISVDENTILLNEIVVKGSRIEDQSSKKGAIRVYGEPDYSLPGEKIGLTVGGSNILLGLQGRVPGLSVVEVYVNGVRSVVVKVRGGSSSIAQNTSPLILVDGIPFEDPNALIGLSRDMIDHVEVITRAVTQFGSRGTNGVIAIYTKGGAYSTAAPASEKNFLSSKIPGYNAPRKFFSPDYSNKAGDKSPDFRTTIFWKPDLVTGPDGKTSVTFYAADIETRYRITLEGVTDKGVPFRHVSFVEVK